MRCALSILGLFLALHLYALPTVGTAALPNWIYTVHPDLNRQPAPDAISEGYFYQLLDLQTNLTRKTEYTHYIINIANESGVQNASEVSVTFTPEFQQVVFHRIAIIRHGAVLNQLALSRIKVIQEEKNAGQFEYDGLKRAYLTLKDLRKGDRIDVAYSVIGFNPVFGNKYSDDLSFNSSTAVCNYYKTILTTAERPLHILSLNNAPSPAEQQLGNTLVYSWTISEKSPTVYVTEYKNWAEVVDWGLNIFDHYHFSLPAGLLQKISSWRALAGDNKDLFANIATRFVQNEIRYLALEIGVNTHQPHSPTEVFNQRFGDCKDKALLLTAILRQEGIPASVALISTETRRQLVNIAPSPRAFDHAIVAIRRANGVFAYVDPTSSNQRGELTDLFLPDYGYALVLEEKETGLQRVTPGRKNDITITEQLDARYYDSSRFNVTSVFSGGAADDVRGDFAEFSLKDVEEKYRKNYASIFDGIRLIDPIAFTDDSLKNEFTVNEHYAIPQLWNNDKKGKKYFEFDAKILDEALPDPADAPDDAPISLNYPYHLHYTLDLSLPEEWDFGSEDLHIKNDAYQFDFTPLVKGNHMILTYTFTTFKDHLPAAEIRQYKEDYKNLLGKIAFQLYKEENPPSTRDWNVCWPAIWLTFFFSLFFSRLFVWLNSRTEETLYAPGSGYPLGGWLTLLGVSIGINLLFETIRLIRENNYGNSNWVAFGNAGGANLQYLVMAELAIHLSFIAGAGAVIYWFIQKRDIFPRMFLWYNGILLSGRLLLVLLYSFTPVPASFNTYKYELTGNFIRTLVYAAVCVTYILRSGQVKSTFLEPFRERIR